MPYCYMPATMVSSGYRHNADLYNYDDVNANHPDWFLLDSNGQRILFDDTYYLDIGRSGCARAGVAEFARLSEPLRAPALYLP
jgi:hypothetical protein